MSTIPERQNEPAQLDKLAAQRHLYSKAKLVQGWQFILSVPAVILWSFVVLAAPELRAWAALWGIAVTILDTVALDRWQKSLKETAARVQELFDCDVLQLEWQDLKIGRKPDAELIHEASAAWRRRNPDDTPLRNWYAPIVSKLPSDLGRLVCQRSNCWWDTKLRRRYAVALLIGFGVLTTLVVTLSLIGGITFEKFLLTGLAPLMPATTLVIRQVYEHNDSADRSSRLEDQIERLWDRALHGRLSSAEAAARSRQVQDEIFEHRRRSPLIFDWIYGLLRGTQEEQMTKGAEALVQEALSASTPLSQS